MEEMGTEGTVKMEEMGTINPRERLLSNIQNNDSANRAKIAFRHYYGLVAKKAGLPLGNDNITELFDMIDDIVEAAVVETIKEINNRVTTKQMQEVLQDMIRKQQERCEVREAGDNNCLQDLQHPWPK